MELTTTTSQRRAPRRPSARGRSAVAFFGFLLLAATVALSPASSFAASPTASAHGVSISERAARLAARMSPRNVAPSPNFLGSCGSSVISAPCVAEELAAIDNARETEGVAPMQLNLAAFSALSATEQVFVVTNLERTARGLAPVAALLPELDTVAQRGAASSSDPSLKGWSLRSGEDVTAWASNWSGSLDVLGADYVWMYDDGVGYNLDCPTSHSSGCWGHRDNVLLAAPTTASCVGNGGRPELVMGASVLANGYHGTVGIGEIFVESCGGTPPGASFNWRIAKHLIFAGGLSS